jgi:hypothetical protein
MTLMTSGRDTSPTLRLSTLTATLNRLSTMSQRLSTFRLFDFGSATIDYEMLAGKRKAAHPVPWAGRFAFMPSERGLFAGAFALRGAPGSCYRVA